MEKFIIIKDFVRTIKRFNTKAQTVEFNIKPVPPNADPVKWVRGAIEEIVIRSTKELKPSDQVGFTFCSKDFQRGQGWCNFKPAAEVTIDDIWNKISSIYQSNSTGLNTETFCLGVTSVRLPVGKGRARKYNNFQEECLGRRGIVCIKNTDNLCLPRALVVARAHVTKDPSYKKLKDNQSHQKEEALQLTNEADVKIPAEGAGIPELQIFQQYLKGYKIVIYKYGTKGREVIFSGSEEGPSLNLLFHKGHYNPITSLTAAFCCTYYCEVCHTPYDHKHEHRCGGTCFGCCRTPACSKKEIKIRCNDCNRSFYGQECYNSHKDSVCKKIKRCIHCFKIYTKSHICGEVYCKPCGKYQPTGHLCFIQPDNKTPQTSNFLFIFYDLETRQEKQLPDGSFLHEPNLCVFRQFCHNCLNEKNLFFCQTCGSRQIILKENVISSFLKHILSIGKKFKQVVVFAQNGGGFDHQFILNYILTETDLTPDLIMRGTKLILLNIANVKFLDSLNYFPMALSKFPKSFGLSELKKGYFPHLFNTLEHQNYIGPIPNIKYYAPDNLKELERSNLIKWHTEKEAQNYVFDFQKEIIEYCVSDVDILSQACLKFRQQMLDTTNVCPFTEATTIASTCNKVFRRNFLKPNTIGLIPKGGYRFRDNQSTIALQWLIWEEHIRKINITHAAKGPESIVAGVKVDGWSPETNQIFEFQGCYYHGCTKCYKYGRNKPLADAPSETIEYRYENTKAKIEHLQNKGYEVIQMWECNFRQLMDQNEELKNYIASHHLLNGVPLNPRDALYGGRTGNIRTYYKVQKDEKIKYVDVCSLYPWACKYGKFPVGHPKIHVGEECSNLTLSAISGVIKCKVLPPTNLFHPVLPHKMNNKLMFVLCKKCGEEVTSNDCQHNVKERAMTGTWIIEEVVKAIEKGYKVLEIYEIWEYDTVQFDSSREGLFTAMMNKFIKIKQEASGWPSQCETDEQKQRYINQFLKKEDIQLDFNEISDNPGLRSLAKLMLNSFWGKFGQRENLPKTKIVNDPADFFNMITNSSIYVNTVVPVNENTMVVTYEEREETYTKSSTVNVVIAAYVTTLARLKLYSYLEELGSNCCYYDTDSVIFISTHGSPDIPTGEFIGDMTDELLSFGQGSYITEFSCGGPKNYAFNVFVPSTNENHVVCKVKGLTLNYRASQIVNLESIKKMVLNKEDPVSITSLQITRNKEHEVISKPITKIYRPNSLKRKFFDDGSSVPFGFKTAKTKEEEEENKTASTPYNITTKH